MRLFAKMILVSVAAFAATDTSFAQIGFTTTPVDTIVASIPLGAAQLLTFQQRATASATLNLSWQQLSASIPVQWEVTLCDNGTCYPNLPLSGSMAAVPLGDYGFMTLDVKPHTNAGTAVVRYAVWDAGNSAAKDTLTWIVHSNTTAISNTKNERPIAFAAGKTLFIRNAFSAGQKIALYDVAGKLVFQKSLSMQDEVIELSFLNDGAYVLIMSHPENYSSQKIFIGSSQ